ncbi:MAG: hypothetical protein KME26_05145 [Oscillatoria princeps RMCB-10]|nr:hypothetical protein [Oscillatoria princeps RMCB-10]
MSELQRGGLPLFVHRYCLRKKVKGTPAKERYLPYKWWKTLFFGRRAWEIPAPVLGGTGAFPTLARDRAWGDTRGNAPYCGTGDGSGGAGNTRNQQAFEKITNFRLLP